jgi:pyruvate kinase
MHKNTKIIATLGPSSNEESILENMIQAGINVARLNFSHGAHEEHGYRIKMIRKLSRKNKTPIAILQDLQGPKLRIGLLPDSGILLKSGQKILLKRLPGEKSITPSDKEQYIIPLDIPDVIHTLYPGGRILMDDGKLEFVIDEINHNEIHATVLLGGTLSSHKGVNLPGTSLNIPGFTDKDQQDLEFGLKNQIDAVAISFVHNAIDILTIREFIKRDRKSVV